MSTGQTVFANPEITGLSEVVKAKVIKVRNNPFIGREIAVRDDQGRIFFGPESYFQAE